LIRLFNHCVFVVAVEAAWQSPHKQLLTLHGPGVGTPVSVKRRLGDLFRMLQLDTWNHLPLTVCLTSPATRDLARSLGPIYRWPAGMTCATQALHDLVTGKNNQVVEVLGVVWTQPPAARGSPSSKQFADTLFVPLGPGRRFCLLCFNTYTQNPKKGYTNYLTHLRVVHDDCLAEYRFRCASE
jgi:hypothetical protein